MHPTVHTLREWRQVVTGEEVDINALCEHSDKIQTSASLTYRHSLRTTTRTRMPVPGVCSIFSCLNGRVNRVGGFLYLCTTMGRLCGRQLTICFIFMVYALQAV